MTIIKGSDVLGIVNGIPIFCGLDLTFTENKDTVERTPDFGAVGKWTYNALVKRGWAVDITGLTKIDPSDGQEDYFTMISDPFDYTYQVLTLSFTDQQGNNVSLTGVMFLQGSSITGPATGFANASVKFIGTGEYVLSTEGSSTSGSSSCVPVGSGAFSPSDGTLGSAYHYTLLLSGTNPKTLGAISGNPAWMTISVATGNLVLGGTPTSFSDVGTFFLDIVINNDCGSIHLIDEGGATINENGRNVFVINNSSSDVVLTNFNGHSYTFLASNGSDGNIKMQNDTVNITSVTGTKNFEFLQTLPSTTVNSGTFSSGSNVTTSNLSITNYLRFT
jgi:hypothetical protein